MLLSNLKQKYITDYKGTELYRYILGCYNRGETGMSRRKSIKTEYSEMILEQAQKYKLMEESYEN